MNDITVSKPSATNVREAISKLRASLAWEIKEGFSHDGNFHIVSNPRRRKHIIYWPSTPQKNPPRQIEFLHELCHAWLAENVHHQFSAQYFVKGCPEHIIRRLTPACWAASDWFADQKLYEIAPEETKAEIAECLHLLKQVDVGNNLFLLYSKALMLAQGKHYLGQGLKGKGLDNQVAAAILSVRPEAPNVEKLETLVNRLLSAAQEPWQISLVEDQGLEVWQVFNV